ncbi:MAG: prepilin peptidase, partial [Anaerolineae bacterium]
RGWELLPVVGYLLVRGRCRTCGQAIGKRSPLVELATGLLFVLAFWLGETAVWQDWLALALTSVFLSIFVLVTLTDLEHGLILNKVIWPGIWLAAAATLLKGWPAMSWHWLAGGIGAGLIILIIKLVPGGMGWGDVRLTGFIGLVTGLPGLWFALFVGFVLGGLVAAVLLATGQVKRGDTLPLGPFLALGGTAVLLFGPQLVDGFYALARLI